MFIQSLSCSTSENLCAFSKSPILASHCWTAASVTVMGAKRSAVSTLSEYAFSTPSIRRPASTLRNFGSSPLNSSTSCVKNCSMSARLSPSVTCERAKGVGTSSEASLNLIGMTRRTSPPAAARAAPWTAPASQRTQGFWIELGVRRIREARACLTWVSIQRTQSSPIAIPPSSSLLVEYLTSTRF